MTPYENAVNHALDAFDDWAQENLVVPAEEGQPITRLANSERAILKTFLWYALQRKEELKKHGISFDFEELKKAPLGAGRLLAAFGDSPHQILDLLRGYG